MADENGLGSTRLAPQRLDGKVAIVTGAGSSGPGIGNGRAESIVLAARGALVVALDRDQAALDETASLVDQVGGTCVTMVGDVSLEQTAIDVVAKARESFGGLDILVNNVGIDGPGDGIRGTDAEAWDQAFRINITSVALMAKHAIPEMETRGGGAIVNLGSVAALGGTGGQNAHYSASKGAVVALTRHLATVYGPAGIRVNAVAPGMVYTPMVAGRLDQAARDRHAKAAPLRVEGNAWDVAYAVAFLVSDDAKWISGVLLPVDGGLMANVPSTEGKSYLY